MPPRPWEQLGGYYLRAARALDCSVNALVPHRRGGRLQLAGLSAVPTELEMAEAAERLALTAHQVRAMTLHRFATGLFARAVSGDGEDGYRVPVMVNGGMYCAECVREGHWDLRWKTGLVAVCVKHRQYLWAACPRCDRPVSPDHLAHTIVDRHERMSHFGCAGFLRADRQPVGDSFVRTQFRINALLDGAQTDATAAAAARDVIRWADYLRRGPGRIRSFIKLSSIEASREDLARLLTIGLKLVAEPEYAYRHGAVREAVQLRRALQRSPYEITFPAYRPGKDAVRDAIGHLATEPIPIVIVPSPGMRGAPDALPQVIPMSLFNGVIEDVLKVFDPDTARMVVALSVGAPEGRAFLRPVSVQMGMTAPYGERANNVLRYLEVTGHADVYWAAIPRIREQILNAGIDFRARAETLNRDDTLVVAAKLAWPPLRDVPTAQVQSWLLERWACRYAVRDAKPPRATLDALIGGYGVAATLWRTWTPEIEALANRRAAS